MKRARSDAGDEHGTYASTRVETPVCTALARLYNVWKEQKRSKTDFLGFISEAGYVVTERTLTNWVSNVKAHGCARPNAGEAGRPKALSDAQERILVGFVLQKNEKNVDLTAAAIRKFLDDKLGLDVEEGTVRNYLHANGFRNRLSQSKTSGYKFSVECLQDLAYQWLTERRRVGVFSGERSDICSIDFTFTGHRTHRLKTWTPKGSAQPRSDGNVSNFTNCIVTCIWADGVNRTPPVLFTYNKKFLRNRPGGPSKAQQNAKLEHWLEKYEIDLARIVFIGRRHERTLLKALSCSRNSLSFIMCRKMSQFLVIMENRFFQKMEAL